MFPLLLLVVMVTCNAQHPQGRCDEVQTVRLFSPCTSCAIVQSTSCPRDSRLVTKATESTNCRYKVEIGGKVKMVPGCSHTCEKKVMKPRCCPDTWGPLCVPCPTWNGRTCNWHGTCVDGMTGNGTCVCEAGFSGFACQECKNKNTYGEHCDSQCKCVHGQCNNGPSGDGECYCQPPYTGPRCDQVSTSCKACSAYSYCKQSGGAEACECLPGFKKVGHTCTGDMCSRDVCDQNADCTNLDGGHYQCRCKVGYEGNGRVCVPLNSCASNHGDCPFNSTLCVYTAPGRSHCVCRHGFEGSTPEMGCTLKSACRQNTCHRTARCQTGMDGLPRCTCGAQEIGDGRRCYGNILDRLLELNRDGPQKGNLTGAIRLFENGCQLTLSKHGPFTAFIPVLRYPLNGVSETFLCKNHLVLQQNVLKDLQGKDFWTLGLEGLRFRNNEKFLFKKDPYTMYSVIQSDIAASNGIIHIISGPITNLQPPTSDSEQLPKQTVGEILVNDPKYKSFQSIWDNSGISFNLRGPGPFTVFVPTNSALDKFSHNTEYMQDQARHKLHTLLRHHVTTGSMASVEDLAATDSFQSEANDRIYINIRQDGRLEFDEAGVHLEAGDIVAANGIIHVIDGVLVPPSILPIMPHRCDVTESRIMLGFCKSCDHVNETHCPANSIQMEGSPLGCAYLSIPDNVSTKGCTQLCNITKTRSDCCKGFYGNDCKPCVGGFQHPCYDKGQCMDGIHGNGSCICEPEYTGLACHICTDEKKYGENCDLDCRCVHGVCDHKRNSSGLCKPGSCQSGFSGDMCEMKITECSEYQTETCHYLADCVQNVTGQPACVCRAGYEGDGISCLPVNLCLRHERGGCDRNAECEYTDQGQVTCTCREGWTGDGEVCTEVDSCLLESRGGCHDDAECSSVGPGQSECTCKDGYQGDGKYCDLISPCIRYNGGCHYLATCEYSRNGTQSCTCPTGYEGNGTVCYGSIRMELDSNHQYYWFNELVQASQVDDLDRNITALIPANRGFYELGRIKREYWKDPYRTPYLVKAHILEGIYTSEDLRQLVNKKVTTLNSKTSWEITIADTMLKIGKATITKPDNLAINGLIHVIDTVLQPSLSEIPPPPPTLIEFLNNTPTYSLFMQALLLYNITDKVTAKENTILLPSDQAVKEHLQRTNSTQLDEDTAKYHIVPDVKLLPEDVLSGMTKKTLLGFHYQIMFHVGTKNESMANEVLLDGNVTEIRYAIVIPISRVLEIHKNYCNKEVFLRSSGRCGPCDEPPRCSYRGKPLGGGFPPGMKPNCQYRKRDGRIRYTASGCMIDCFRAEEQEECCPGFYGPTCYRCPATNDQVCSNRGKCQDGLLGTGACVCQQGFNGTACEKCERMRYGASCQSVCNCVHGICADGIKGDGKCLCHKGWKGPTCSVAIVADECGGTCDVNANCVAPSGSGPKCFCVAGYQGDGKVCKAINPCDHDNGSCSKDAKCAKISPGVWTCTCNQGYTGDGTVCQATDPCLVNHGGCHEKAECLHTGQDQVVCTCMAGYSGNGHSCSPLNPCKHENGGCSVNAWCENSGQGQRNCTCRKGYIGDGFTCKGKIATEIRRHPDASWFSTNLAAAKVGDLLGDGVYTLFVPHSDYASNFTMELWTNRSRNRDLLRNHIVGCEKLFLADLRSGGNVVTFAGQKLHFSVQKGDVYINEKTKIITSDEIVFDAVIHFIDGVLVPYDLKNQSKVDPSKFNVTSAAEAYGYTTFSKMLQDSSVQSLIQNPLHQPLSMLWPTEEAFRSMPEERRRWLFNPDHAHQLANYVKAHIIRDIILTAGMLPLTGSARTLFGSILSFSCDKNTVGNILVDDGNAKIIERHLEFDVGIAHGIDQLLEPPGLGARCDSLEMVKVSGVCVSCDLTPRCSHGMTFTGKVSSCVNYRPWIIHKLYRTYRPRYRRGCSAECMQVKWTPRCCKNHYGRDCEVCPGGLEAPCSNHGDCNDGEQGMGNCTCQPGFRGTACELCESGHYGPNCTACTCTENGRCAEQLDGDGSCFCHEGWTGARCEIKLEIKPNCTPTCHPKAVCQPENVCQCEPLYEGDGRTCTAPDLCREYNGGCNQNADCVQTGVQVTCTCRSGYWGDGVTCAPINRCVQEPNGGCSLFANCRFTGPNVRECECLPGYVGDGFQCLLRVVPPEDRCLEDNGGCDPKALCKDLHFHENTAGVFHLSSPKGRYKLNYKDARAACEGEDATLATLTQLSHAQQLGMHLCMAGWLDGAQVGFPTRFPSLICGNNRVGVVTYKSPVDTSSTYDAYCYRVKDVFCECGPQYVGSGEFCNGNLASVVATNAKFSVFYSTLLKLASSSKEGKRLIDFLTAPSVSITLFVPQDSGFIANQTLTWRDVEYHISTNNSLHFYGNLTHGSVLRSQLGFNLSVAISTNSSDESQPIKMVNRQRIIDWDIPTTNGIIHVIERPLKAPPPVVLPHHTAGDASTHSSGAAGPVFSVFLLIGAGAGLLYCFLKHKKEPYKFHYFKAEEDIDDETRTEDEGGQKQDESKPMQVSFANPVYRERPAAGQPFNEENSENVQEDSSESRNIFD